MHAHTHTRGNNYEQKSPEPHGVTSTDTVNFLGDIIDSIYFIFFFLAFNSPSYLRTKSTAADSLNIIRV